MGIRDIALAAAASAMAAASLTYWLMLPRRRHSSPKENNPKEEEPLSPRLGLHDLNPILQTAGRAKEPRVAKRYFRNQPNKTHVIRIALTGGPCAGKSSALNYVRQRATAAGFDVYCAPEVATLFLNSGVGYPKSAEQQYTFQSSICILQLALERTLTTIVQGTGRPSIIIYDRGILDTKGYVDNDTWQRILSELSTSGATDAAERPGLFTMGVTEDYVLKRYDGVVHLVTAAEGAQEFYKSGQVTDDSGAAVVRVETLQEALTLDHKMRKAWCAHPHHNVIGNEGSFQDKLNATVQVILKLADETHPAECQRARKSMYQPA
ncbi:expressed unknown protein [Seminavis robusta]|uniref:NadR/Ttd14 AAA domain-containing protein n=1 Tax=Seminavis robusta TaxID=568900 RepID=A0A9N8EU75_9STRA|nr:expressed unknown protein [Seminavis robusta]|eukprot:Sro1891_g303830.1 n/a (322) ;mRNA; r:18613-19578